MPIYVMFYNINRKSLISCGMSIGSIDELRSLHYRAFIHALLSRAYLCVSIGFLVM